MNPKDKELILGISRQVESISQRLAILEKGAPVPIKREEYQVVSVQTNAMEVPQFANEIKPILVKYGVSKAIITQTCK